MRGKLGLPSNAIEIEINRAVKKAGYGLQMIIKPMTNVSYHCAVSAIRSAESADESNVRPVIPGFRFAQRTADKRQTHRSPIADRRLSNWQDNRKESILFIQE